METISPEPGWMNLTCQTCALRIRARVRLDVGDARNNPASCPQCGGASFRMVNLARAPYDPRPDDLRGEIQTGRLTERYFRGRIRRAPKAERTILREQLRNAKTQRERAVLELRDAQRRRDLGG